jgi:hypothetical protein
MIIGIFENQFVRCELDDSLPVLRHRWLMEPVTEVFKRNLERILQEYRILRRSYTNLAWLADTELLGELEEEAETWLVSAWEDLLFNEAGVQIHAVILGASIFADYPMEKFKLDAEEKFRSKNIHLGVFSNQAKAYQWMKQYINS